MLINTYLLRQLFSSTFDAVSIDIIIYILSKFKNINRGNQIFDSTDFLRDLKKSTSNASHISKIFRKLKTFFSELKPINGHETLFRFSDEFKIYNSELSLGMTEFKDDVLFSLKSIYSKKIYLYFCKESNEPSKIYSFSDLRRNLKISAGTAYDENYNFIKLFKKSFEEINKLHNLKLNLSLKKEQKQATGFFISKLNDEIIPDKKDIPGIKEPAKEEIKEDKVKMNADEKLKELQENDEIPNDLKEILSDFGKITMENEKKEEITKFENTIVTPKKDNKQVIFINKNLKTAILESIKNSMGEELFNIRFENIDLMINNNSNTIIVAYPKQSGHLKQWLIDNHFDAKIKNIAWNFTKVEYKIQIIEKV